MSTDPLQDYCLQVMGIVQWQRQDAYEFMVFIDEALNGEKNQLVERMLLALKWPKTLCHIEVLKPASKDLFAKILASSGAKKVLIFGNEITKALGLSTTQNPLLFESVEIALLPSLNDLLNNSAMKKQAWQVMQKLM